MTGDSNIPFGGMDRTEDAPGILAQEPGVVRACRATVECGHVAGREDWANHGHRGFVISGRIERQFGYDHQDDPA